MRIVFYPKKIKEVSVELMGSLFMPNVEIPYTITLSGSCENAD
jgi:hypothetical protein